LYDDVWVPGDYHLESGSGRWDPNVKSWVIDDVNSGCIDAGDPNSDWTGELWPHGERINMGAYGGTAEASMSSSEAGNVADLNFDDSVNFIDYAHFSILWKESEILLHEDLNRDGVLDEDDVHVFAGTWLLCE
jgi:hypothetical protein